jgi:hypothetical protein
MGENTIVINYSKTLLHIALRIQWAISVLSSCDTFKMKQVSNADQELLYAEIPSMLPTEPQIK